MAEKNTQLVREAYLTQIQGHLQEVVALAAGCGLEREALEETLRLLWDEAYGTETEEEI